MHVMFCVIFIPSLGEKKTIYSLTYSILIYRNFSYRNQCHDIYHITKIIAVMKNRNLLHLNLVSICSAKIEMTSDLEGQIMSFHLTYSHICQIFNQIN